MEISVILILLTGLALGLGHSLDPDHIVAVSALLCNNRNLRKSIVSATVWGVGHSSVLFGAGFSVLILRVAIPENVVSIFEFAAGVMLIVLGSFVLKPLILNRAKPSQPMIQTGKVSSQDLHVTNSRGHTHIHKSALAGVLQGLGGSAALMLVVLTTVNSVVTGLAFILIFGVGVILGMIGISGVVGSIIAYTASNLEKVHKIIMVVTGTASIVFGIVIIAYIII